MIISDTGFFLAIANRKDRHHEQAVAVAARLREQLVTTWPVMTETAHLLQARLGTHAQMAFLRSARREVFQIFSMTVAHLARVETLTEKYRDLPMDLADASLVVLAEELGHGRILSTDERDFRTYRFKNHKPFRNELLEAR